MLLPSGSGIRGLTNGFTKKLVRFVREPFSGDVYPLALLAAPPPASPLSRSRSPPVPVPPFFSRGEFEDEDERGDEDRKGCLEEEVKGMTEFNRGCREVFSPNRTGHCTGLSLTFRHSNDTLASSTPAENRE